MTEQERWAAAERRLDTLERAVERLNADPCRKPSTRVPMPVVVVVGLALVLFAWTVWPTQWRYDKLRTVVGHTLLLRTHRVTGRVQIMYTDASREWRD